MKVSTVTTHPSCTVATGPHAVELFHLLALKGALRLEGLGLRRRGRSALSIAKQTTGLGTNDRAAHLSALERLIEQARAQVTFVQESST